MKISYKISMTGTYLFSGRIYYEINIGNQILIKFGFFPKSKKKWADSQENVTVLKTL
jgi:hypothetical protein